MTVEVELVNHHGDWLIMTEDGDICADFGNGWSRLEAENLFDSWLMDKRDRFIAKITRPTKDTTHE